jgi:hypothetical protein
MLLTENSIYIKIYDHLYLYIKSNNTSNAIVKWLALLLRSREIRYQISERRPATAKKVFSWFFSVTPG